MNAMKLVLPIIFALLLASNPVACLGLAAALQGCTLAYSFMYRVVYGSPPGSSVSLWCVRSCPAKLKNSRSNDVCIYRSRIHAKMVGSGTYGMQRCLSVFAWR